MLSTTQKLIKINRHKQTKHQCTMHDGVQKTQDSELNRTQPKFRICMIYQKNAMKRKNNTKTEQRNKIFHGSWNLIMVSEVMNWKKKKLILYRTDSKWTHRVKTKITPPYIPFSQGQISAWNVEIDSPFFFFFFSLIFSCWFFEK